MAAVAFPTRTELLTPELLGAALAELRPGVVVEGLRVVDEAHCDTGSASTAGRAVLELAYAAGRDRGLAKSVVLKTVLVKPGAPSSMYRNEVRFYRDLRPGLEIETPRVFASSFDEESGGFGVVMEDLRLRRARFPNATASMNGAQIESALGELARLHAQFWTSHRFTRDLAWLWTPRSGGFYDFLQGAGGEFLRFQLARSAYKQELLTRLGRSFDDAGNELLAYYLDRLRAAGVRTAPDAEDAWLLYRQTAIWGFLIGWMITPVENYGEAMLRANLERLTAALEDLETFAALGG